MYSDSQFQAYLERYKYVMEQKSNLNKNTFTVLSIYQGGITILIAGQYMISKDAILGVQQKHLVFFASFSIVFLILFLSIFSIVFIATGVNTWFRYREDQNKIETEIFDIPSQSSKKIYIWYWYEIYVILAIFISCVIFLAVEYYFVFPFLT